eukprot:CAMPEP_0117503156 /NCGR_PEP_ID=MMETSP0784-20121206/24183_1 /TAXON_ID=39447 /ORGANISM="" /LENGTH=73 /DNA_ID=CAMNT_0005298461 /DNA_START=54 /DNA_END=272 /DNA_ORIENTATION=+
MALFASARVLPAQRFLGALCQPRLSRATPTTVRAYGTSLPIPQPPPGSTNVFHSRMQTPKYNMSNPKWFSIFF